MQTVAQFESCPLGAASTELFHSIPPFPGTRCRSAILQFGMCVTQFCALDFYNLLTLAKWILNILCFSLINTNGRMFCDDGG